MKYCKYLKKRKNKPYCSLLKKEITLSQCQECVNKEYRFPIKGKIETTKNAQYIKNNVKRYNKVHNKMSITVQKTKKLAKLERNRFSVFTDDLKHCYLCEKKKEELHEIFAGRNRFNSMKYGFVLPLCHECHSLNQHNPFFNQYWHKNAQEYWECNIGSRDEFMAVFRRNYL